MAGSSGIQRTLRLVQHLPLFGWEPIVLTVQPIAYERLGTDLLQEVPAGVVVKRAYALDSARHLAILGRYPGALARPDRWMSWQLDGVRQGLSLVKQYSPAVIWSTHPIATAHVIGAALQRRTGLPWVADFRDPMAQEGYPKDPKTWQYFKRIEEQVMRQAALAIFTTPGAASTYRARYPRANAHIEVLENGYDEATFAAAESSVGECRPLSPGHLTLLHSGIVYPSERNPTALFEALCLLKQTNKEVVTKLKVRFRAAVHEDLLHDLAVKYNVAETVEILPAIAYRQALAEMLCADGLLVLQAANCNEQIPAKVYEYLRCRRPIIGLTAPHGDTAGLLKNAGITNLVNLDDAAGIAKILKTFVSDPLSNMLPSVSAVAGASRLARTARFVDLLSHL